MNIASIPNRKNRKHLKEVDNDLSRYSLLNIIGYLTVFIAIVTIGGVYKELPFLVLGLGAGLISLALARVLLVVRFSSFYAKGPGRWRNVFYMATFAQATMWSLFLVILIVRYGMHFNTFFAWFFTLALSSLNIMALPAFYKINKTLIAIFIFPSALAFLFQGQLSTIILSIFLLTYYLVLSRVSAKLSANFWDLNELKRKVEQKTRDVDQLMETSEKSSSAKDEFLSTLTYEVRTPVSSVLGMLSLLKDTDLDEVQSEYVSIAYRAGNSLLELIEDVLEFAKISTKTLELESTLFDIHKIIKNCVEANGPIAHEKGISLSYVCDPDLPTRVIGDPDRLGQILNNLVEYVVLNAEDGEILITLEMDIIRSDAGLLKVSVQDKNKTFTPEEQASLFYAFSSYDRRKRNRFENTRLGLAISKGLISCMRGDIGVSSSSDKGCEIWFTAEFELSNQNYEAKKVESALQDLRVLIIGATEGVMQFLNAELKSFGAELSFFADTDSALSEISTSSVENPVDLIMMDMPLDNLDLLDFSASLAQNTETENIKQIVFSSLNQRGDFQVIGHIESYSSVIFLTKPLRGQNLQDAMNALFDIKPQANDDDRIIFMDNNKNTRILLVEDDEINQMVTKSMLEKLDCSVVVANHGKEALEIFDHQTIDLILMDCLMPEMDGYETTEAIRKMESEMEGDRHTPIIAVTAKTSDGEESRCLATGMDDFMPKPVKLEDLSLKIKHWLGSGQKNEESGIILMAEGNEEELLFAPAKNDEADDKDDNEVALFK